MYDTIRCTHTVDPNGHLYMICRCPAFSRCSMQSKCAFLSIAQENHFLREMKSTSQATMISDVVISFIFFAIISSNKNHISVFLRSTNHHRFQMKGFFKEESSLPGSRWRFDIPTAPPTNRYPKVSNPTGPWKCPGLRMCWFVARFFVGSWKIQKKSGPCQKIKVLKRKTYGTKLSFQNLQSIFQCLRYIPLIGQGTFRKDKNKKIGAGSRLFLDDTCPSEVYHSP